MELARYSYLMANSHLMAMAPIPLNSLTSLDDVPDLKSREKKKQNMKINEYSLSRNKFLCVRECVVFNCPNIDLPSFCLIIFCCELAPGTC